MQCRGSDTQRLESGRHYKQPVPLHVIATTEQDLVKEVWRITGGKGARIVFDPVGGPTVTQLTEAMSKMGSLFQYGALSSEPTPLPLMNVLGKGLTIRGYMLFEITSDPERLGMPSNSSTKGSRAAS